MKELVIFCVLLSLHFSSIFGQAIKDKNQYGNPIVFIDGSTLKLKNQYGEAIYYFDGETIRKKNK